MQNFVGHSGRLLVAGAVYSVVLQGARLRPRSYVWAEKYEAAILELDRKKLPIKIAEAETAIQQRKAELHQKTPISSDEVEAIERASRALNVLKEIAQRSARSLHEG